MSLGGLATQQAEAGQVSGAGDPTPDLRWLAQPGGRGLWLAAAWVALMALLGAVLWGWWFGVGSPGAPPAVSQAASRPAPTVPASAGVALPSASAVLALSNRAQAAAEQARQLALPRHWDKAMAVSSAAAASQAASGVQRTETQSLCGLGPVRVTRVASTDPARADPAAQLELPDELGEQRLAQLWPELTRRLLADARPRQQAAGWVLAINPPASVAGGLPDRVQALQGLVQLALRSGDAWVMVRALQACLVTRDRAGCQGLSARHALRTEPGNLALWLALLTDEPAALDEAMHGMAAARFVDWGYRGPSAMAIDALPRGTPAYLAVLLDLHLLGNDGSASLMGTGQVTLACKQAQAQNDVNRLTQCEAIAQTLAHGSRDLMSRHLGLTLGQQLGWPPAQRAVLEREVRAAEAARAAQRFDLKRPYACDALTSTRAHIAGEAAQGEAAWWLKQAARSVAARPAAER